MGPPGKGPKERKVPVMAGTLMSDTHRLAEGFAKAFANYLASGLAPLVIKSPKLMIAGSRAGRSLPPDLAFWFTAQSTPATFAVGQPLSP